jgi:nucleotide-binding universal stress UspA family protein
MTYATVLVSLAFDQPNASRLAVAGELAERYDARVIGVAAADFSPPLYYTSGEQAQKLLDQGLATVRQRLAELETEFRESMRSHRKELQWRSAVALPAKYIAEQARAADLVIGGSSARGMLTDPFASADPADLVMQVGRPLLVVPPTVSRIHLSGVLVAWKDNPEARRAIVGALPLLRQAGHVSVAEIVEEDGSRDVALANVHDVVDWLSRHHVFASAVVPEQVGKVAAQLDHIATGIGAGIVVAGAYGHSRFREWFLGGETQHLVEQTARCALLAR